MAKRGEVMESCVIIGGLIGMQCVVAANSVLLSYLMSMGLSPLSLVIFTSFSAFLVLSPLCFCFERRKWPKKLSLKLFIQLVLIAFGGVTMFQLLLLKGIKLTSPTMATAMPNLAPGLIFIISVTFRLEKVKLSCIYSKVKIVGTVFCVVGAIAMSVMQSTTVKEAGELPSAPLSNLFDKEKIVGSMYLMAAVIALSCNIVLQATTLADFPAPMSLCAITFLIGAVITTVIELIVEHKFDYGWPVVRFRDLVGYSLLGGMVVGPCLSFNAWAMKKRGPVLVSMFNPVGTMCSLFLSVITIGEYINSGCLASMFVVFAGLYLVLWAKGKEGYASDGELGSEHDERKPLLS